MASIANTDTLDNLSDKQKTLHYLKLMRSEINQATPTPEQAENMIALGLVAKDMSDAKATIRQIANGKVFMLGHERVAEVNDVFKAWLDRAKSILGYEKTEKGQKLTFAKFDPEEFKLWIGSGLDLVSTFEDDYLEGLRKSDAKPIDPGTLLADGVTRVDDASIDCLTNGYGKFGEADREIIGRWFQWYGRCVRDPKLSLAQKSVEAEPVVPAELAETPGVEDDTTE